MKLTFLPLAIAACVVAFDASAATPNTVTTFSDGQMDDWYGRHEASSLTTSVDTTFGNDAPALRSTGIDFLKVGIRFATDSSAYTGDLTKFSSVTFSVDMDTIAFSRVNTPGAPQMQSNLYLDLLDYNHPAPGYDASILSINLGSFTQGTGWTKYQVTFDPRTTTLGDSWSTNDPSVSLQQLLSNVTEVAFRTDAGSKKLGAIGYDIAVDNMSFNGVSAVPEPSEVSLLLGGIGVLAMYARRKRAQRAV